MDTKDTNKREADEEKSQNVKTDTSKTKSESAPAKTKQDSGI